MQIQIPLLVAGSTPVLSRANQTKIVPAWDTHTGLISTFSSGFRLLASQRISLCERKSVTHTAPVAVLLNSVTAQRLSQVGDTLWCTERSLERFKAV